jgi:hypothetical protein
MVVGNDRHGETQGVTGGVRNKPRRSSTAISPLVWGPAGVTLCPSISENDGVDERSIRGVFPSSWADTKLVSCHWISVIV